MKGLLIVLTLCLFWFSCSVGRAGDDPESPMPITLTKFKSGFNQRMLQLNPKYIIKGPGEETTAPDEYFCYPFTKLSTEGTAFHIYSNKKGQLTNIELDTADSQAPLFWLCVDAMLCALEPAQTASHRASIIRKLGKYIDTGLPAENSEWIIDGPYAFLYTKPKYIAGGNVVIYSVTSSVVGG
jgi:hypothetical protein